ncbi:MAG: hypothetical protein H7333_06680 [Bdellovibrionales bacterium]|nr:hypothetical protein [Oligoflexia bacterium]
MRGKTLSLTECLLIAIILGTPTIANAAKGASVSTPMPKVESDNNLPTRLMCELQIKKGQGDETWLDFRMMNKPIVGLAYKLPMEINRTQKGTRPGEKLVSTDDYLLAEKSHSFNIDRARAPGGKDGQYELGYSVSTLLKAQPLKPGAKAKKGASAKGTEYTFEVNAGAPTSKPQFISEVNATVTLACKLQADSSKMRMDPDFPKDEFDGAY